MLFYVLVIDGDRPKQEDAIEIHGLEKCLGTLEQTSRLSSMQDPSVTLKLGFIIVGESNIKVIFKSKEPQLM